MSDDLRLPLDRVTYREGQRLAARDLADDRRRDARLRRLHLRALHDTWGIALGFEVEQVDDDGEAVDSGGIVAVGKGYAVDGQGRELLLAESVRPTLPRTEAPEIRVLTARYRQDGAYSESTDLAAVCLCGGLDPRHERPCFAWRRQDEVCFGPEVPLVQATISNGRIQGELDLRVRRYARSLARPHLATGTTDSGRSGWRPWLEGDSELGLELVVDTSEAGFTRSPFYFPTLQGDFGNRAGQDPLVEPDLWGAAGTDPSIFLDALSFVAAASPEGFTYRLLARNGLPFGFSISAAEAENRGWTISWLGVEPVRGCEPVLDLASLYTLSGFPVFTA